MDVRCERCQTEYELDDGSVSDSGTDVQCTSCGHTFVVARAAADEIEDAPPTADWMLETPDGRVHRFRNLTSLQKWIIERKVTREDRISRVGHGWRQLGDIVELAPFFDVVDEADRARAARAGARNLVAEAALARQAGLGRTPAQGLPAQGLPAAAPTAAAAAAAAPAPSRPARPGSSAGSASAPAVAAEVRTEVVRLGGSGWLKMTVGVAVAGVVAFIGIRFWQTPPRLPGLGRPSHAAPSLEPSPPPPEPGGPAPGKLAPESAPVATGTPAEAAPPAGAPPAAVPPGEVAPVPPPVRRAALEAAAAKRPPGEGSYERLVDEGDRALESGARERAAKLYDRALALRPAGIEAMTGLGYVHLDRNRPEVAVGYFQRALTSGKHPPALFGIAEAHRAAGAAGAAAAAYRDYLETAPNGEDASAARRQLKTLEARPAEGNAPPPSPASVLDEPAAK